MNTWLSILQGGALQLGPWALLAVTLVLTHVTIVAVTLYLHRSQAHRGWPCTRPWRISSGSGCG
jgi:stearoyl-CoA desaturase (delta-9 desaturase)